MTKVPLGSNRRMNGCRDHKWRGTPFGLRRRHDAWGGMDEGPGGEGGEAASSERSNRRGGDETFSSYFLFCFIFACCPHRPGIFLSFLFHSFTDPPNSVAIPAA